MFGQLSHDERDLVKQARNAAMQQQLDVNGDGEVSDLERAGFDQVKSERGDKKRRSKKGHKHGEGETQSN